MSDEAIEIYREIVKEIYLLHGLGLCGFVDNKKIAEVIEAHVSTYLLTKQELERLENVNKENDDG